MNYWRTSHSRRDFCAVLSSLFASATLGPCLVAKGADRLGETLPRRRLGKTGLEVTQYCPGGWHIELMEEKDSERAIDYSIEHGVRFFDTSVQYGEGRSEELYGKYLTPKYRDEVIIRIRASWQ